METFGNRNRNPFNIRFNSANNWQGQTGQNKGFCVFDTVENGLRAGIKLLRNYIKGGYRTVREIINRYAPHSENPTDSYISFVCSRSGFRPDEILICDANTIFKLAEAITYFESRYTLDRQVFDEIYKKL